MLGHVVTTKNTLQNFVYTRILEPIVDLVISHSIVTSWSVDALTSLLGSEMLKSLAHTCSIHNKFMSTLCIYDVQTISIANAH